MKKIMIWILCVLICMSGTSVAYAVETNETPSGIPMHEMEETIDRYMDTYVGQSTPGAAVVIVRDGEIILSKGYGYADINNKIPVSARTTVFEQGSISKLLVYTSIMRLKEQGRIDLEADMRTYLPEGFLRQLKYNQPITMLDIMNHTTGFEDYLFDTVVESPELVKSLEETLISAQPRQVYAPGEVSAYSNYAVTLAGYIVERIVGQDFHSYVMETIYEPLHMDNTSLHPMQEDRPAILNNKAKGYMAQVDGGFAEESDLYITIYPSGAMNGTAEDLARFAIALMPEEGKQCILFDKRQTLDEMLANTYKKTSFIGGIAHGFFEWECPCRALGHGGGTAAYTAQMNIVPDERFGVIVLTNAKNEYDITVGLTDLLIGKSEACSVESTDVMPSASAVEGSYVAARRRHSSFLEFTAYLSLLNVKAVDENTIVLSMDRDELTMTQSHPYVYRSNIDTSNAMLDHYSSGVYFDVREGRVHSMWSGEVAYMPLSAGRTKPWLLISVLVVVLATLYFIITPIVILIQRVLKKKPRKSKLYQLSSALVLSGTMLLANNVALILRMLWNSYTSYAKIKIHIMLNYPLSVLVVVIGAMVVTSWKKEMWSKNQKIFIVVTMVMLVGLIMVLINWKFFNVMM